MSIKSSGVLQPDGSICRKGASCKRHGADKKVEHITPAEEILQQIVNVKKNTAQAETHPLFPKGNVIRHGMNTSDDTIALKTLDNEADNFRENLSIDEDNAVTKYSMTSYDYVNRYLRKGEEGIVEYLQHAERQATPTQKQIDAYIGYAKNIIPHLDSAFAKHDASNQEERLLYKAFRVRTPDGVKTTPADIESYVEEHYPIGKVLSNKAYTSTSVDSDYMLAFARRSPEQVIVHEIVSKNGIPIHESDWRRGGGVTDAEREILLARETKLKVVGIKKVTFESTYPEGRPTCSSFYRSAPKKKRYTVIQMIEVE